jgi:hypothetical protein
MNKKVSKILLDIAEEHRIEAFRNRKIFKDLLSSYLNGHFIHEAKLLIRVSDAGYISSLVRSKDIFAEKERLINCLYDDESIDKNISLELLELLLDVIQYAKKRR